jgi:diaminopimelate epimerase
MMLSFLKMHGLGNDFILFDARAEPVTLSRAEIVALCDRHTGIGADTIAVIGPAPDGDADASVRFFNADGGAIGTCGNATRCIARLLFDQSGRDRVRLATEDGLREAWLADGGIAVDMGRPRFAWQDIPLAEPADTLHLPLFGPLADPVGVNMGNPHAVFFVADVDEIALAELGPAIEHAPLFPDRVNVEIATIEAPGRIRMRVWERGAGITLACGSGACATLVAAVRRGLSDRRAVVALDGGDLTIEWRDDDRVVMTGPVATSFSGRIDPSLLPGRVATAA